MNSSESNGHDANTAGDNNEALSSDPRDTDHPTGHEDAAENAEEESPA